MEGILIPTAAILNAVIVLGIAVFQVLLSFGYPLGEFTMGGYHKILPKRLRWASSISALILLIFALIFLQQAKVVSFGLNFILTNKLVWVFTGYLALNTIANLVSRSKKERLVMTPISTISLLLCLIIDIAK